jgi:hypothetical protein
VSFEEIFGKTGYRLFKQVDNSDRRNWLQVWNPYHSVILTMKDNELESFIENLDKLRKSP